MPLTATSERRCVHCGGTVGTIPLAYGDQTRYFWRTCPCREQAWIAEQEHNQALDAAYRQAQADRVIGDTGMQRVAHLSLASFDPTRLRAPKPEEHPYNVATTWLNAVLDYGPCANYRDVASPPAALYLYSPGRGRGKTHLAAGLALEAQQHHKLTTFVNEIAYLTRRWSCALAELDKLTALPGERAWLTVLDDLGQRANVTPAVADAWYDIFDRRWMRAGWTIITSNKTPEELWEHGTINDATYSRLRQMIRQPVLFNGSDYRLE